MPKKERPSQENKPENNASPEAEKALEDELSAAQKDIEAERSWRKETDISSELPNPEEGKESVEYIKPRAVAEMIEAGVSDKDIWEAAKEAGRFYEFDGSSYYLSKELSDPDSGIYWWKRESAAGNKSGAGDRQDDMFRDKIENKLEDYRDLLDAFDTIDDLFAAINTLKERDEKVKKKKLLEMSSTDSSPEQVDESDKKEEEPAQKPADDKAAVETTEEPETKVEEESEVEKEEGAAPETDKEDAEKEQPDEDKESAEQEPGISVGDPVHRKINGARRWSEPREVESIITDDEGQRYVKTQGGDDASYHPEDEFERAGSKEISAEVAEEFNSQFDISVEDLSTISGFEELSEGQQQLVLENFRKLTLSRIKEEGIGEYREDKANSGAMAGMWKGFMSSYYKNKHITETGKELLSGGIDMHKAALADVVQSTKESGLDLNEEGELVFARHEGVEDLTDQEREIIKEFNNAAQSFAQTAVEWKYEDGWSKLTGGNREAYQDKRNQYEEALGDYIDLLCDRKGLSAGLRQGAETDKKVRFAQFFAGDSKYENALQNIKADASWKQLISSVGREKGAYMAMGMASRTSAIGLINTVAAPIVATGLGGAAIGAGLGAYKGRSSAVETLEDDAKLGSGGGKEQSDLINTVPAEQLTNKLRNLIDKVEDPNISQEKRGEVAASLVRRIRYTEQKIDGGTYFYEDENGDEQVAELSGGLVDYGDVDGRSGRQYQLLQTLNEAQAMTVVHDPEVNEEINNRLDKYLDYKDEKTRTYVREKTRRGAVYAGAFGGILGTIAGLGIFGGDDAAEVPDTDAGAGNEGGGSSSDAEIIGGNEGGGTDLDAEPGNEGGGEAAADSTGNEGGGEAIQAESAGGGEEIPTPEIGSQQITIDEAGEGMIHAIADKLSDEYGVSHEKAMEIGNELFLKGEQLKGDDEMFNLVGEGATFSIDFGELTPTDLQEQSADDLADTIDFDQNDFNAGDSGIKGEELPEQETDMEAVNSSDAEGQESMEQADINEDNAFLNPNGPGEDFGISQEEFQSWKEEMESKGVVVEENGGEQAAQATETEPASATEAREVPVESETPSVESGAQSEIDSVPVSHLRGKVAYVDALLQTDTDLVAEIPQTRMNALSNLLERYDDMSLSESIAQIGEDDPRLLTVLERSLTADNIDGEPLSQNDQRVLDYVRQQVNQLSASDFENGMPPYVQESLAASEEAVGQQ